MPNWEFDRAKGLERSVHRKGVAQSAGRKPNYEDNTESFRQILVDIQQFALQIGSNILRKCVRTCDKRA